SAATPQNCSQSGQERASAVIELLDQAAKPNEEQHSALEKLRGALTKAFDAINAACREVQPLTPTARLKAMQEQLFAFRNAGLSVRTALTTFYESLSEEQRLQFDKHDSTGAEPNTASKNGQSAAQICAAQAQAAYAWPADLIGRRVRPNQQQRASLEAL